MYNVYNLMYTPNLYIMINEVDYTVQSLIYIVFILCC